jgi:hypothetical protein
MTSPTTLPPVDGFTFRAIIQCGWHFNVVVARIKRGSCLRWLVFSQRLYFLVRELDALEGKLEGMAREGSKKELPPDF